MKGAKRGRAREGRWRTRDLRDKGLSETRLAWFTILVRLDANNNGSEPKPMQCMGDTNV